MIRSFYMRKIRFTQQNYHDKLTDILTQVRYRTLVFFVSVKYMHALCIISMYIKLTSSPVPDA